MCSLAHRLDGHFHGWSGATGGADCCSWQWWHSCTDCSMSFSRFGHHTYIVAKDFIFVMPGCPSWSSCNTASQRLGGIITRDPHIRQPWWTDNSIRLEPLVLNNLSYSLGHPRSTWFSTLESTGSRLVLTTMWRAVTGKSSKYFMSSTSSGGVLDSFWVSETGSLLRASALLCAWVFLNLMYS